MEWVDVVDGNNRVLGVAERAKVRRENLCHRASYILVLDDADRILLTAHGSVDSAVEAVKLGAELADALKGGFRDFCGSLVDA